MTARRNYTGPTIYRTPEGIFGGPNVTDAPILSVQPLDLSAHIPHSPAVRLIVANSTGRGPDRLETVEWGTPANWQPVPPESLNPIVAALIAAGLPAHPHQTRHGDAGAILHLAYKGRYCQLVIIERGTNFFYQFLDRFGEEPPYHPWSNARSSDAATCARCFCCATPPASSRPDPQMLFLASPSTPEVRAAMIAGDPGCITTLHQGNRAPSGSYRAADNGRFGNGWPGPPSNGGPGSPPRSTTTAPTDSSSPSPQTGRSTPPAPSPTPHPGYPASALSLRARRPVRRLPPHPPPTPSSTSPPSPQPRPARRPPPSLATEKPSTPTAGSKPAAPSRSGPNSAPPDTSPARHPAVATSS